MFSLASRGHGEGSLCGQVAGAAASMKVSSYGRVLFATSAVLCGVVGLSWHNSDLWQSARQIRGLAVPTIVGASIGIAQVGGGLGLLFRRTVRVASAVIGVAYLLLTLACIPAIVAAPAVYVGYGNFFEHVAYLSGAVAAYGNTERNAGRLASLARAARVGLGLSAVSFALEQAVYLRATAHLVPTWIPPSQMFWALLTTAAFALAAVAILINREVRRTICLLTLMLLLFAALVWVPHLIADPKALPNWSEFGETLLISGSSWMIGGLQSL
ncbi:MAG: hypothetical protein ABSB70_05390 [Candidatus Velthaea sp.]